MKTGKKLLNKLKEIIYEEAGTGYFDERNIEAGLRNLFTNDSYQQLMENAPCIVGVYNFREGYYMFLSKNIEYELEIQVHDLIGKENAERAFNTIHPEHGELWVFQLIPKVMEYYTSAGSREEALKISYTICFLLQTKQKEKKWFFTETDLLEADEHGVPLLSIFYMSNINEIKKDDLIYYSIKRKGENGQELLYYSSFPYEESKFNLTNREIEILKLIGTGKTTQEVATQLSISKNTIDNHRKNMLAKTNTSNITELLSVVMYRGYI